MLRANRPILAFFDSLKSLRVRQLAMILKAGYDPNLMINARGQNGLQFLINYFGATEAHYRLQAPINKSAYLSIAKLLLDSGLDPNILDLLAEETVLFDAIRYNDKEMVALLLNYVDFSLRNKNGETALMCAARFGSKQITRLLLEHLRHLDMDDYFLRQRNRFGLTPLEIARSENLEAAKMITKHLIAYGPHTPLARSVSHHSLAALDARRAGANFRPGAASVARRPRAPLAAEMLLADEYMSPSDYEDEMLAAAAAASGRRPTLLGATPLSRRAPFNGACPGAGDYQAYFGPKAAEFSQYLLEQQQHQQQQRQQHGIGSGGRADGLSDDDLEGPDADGFGSRSGPLLRSRSCMLGPAAAGLGGSSSGAIAGAKANSKLDQGPGGPGKMGATGWQDQSSGDAGGRQQ